MNFIKEKYTCRYHAWLFVFSIVVSLFQPVVLRAQSDSLRDSMRAEVLNIEAKSGAKKAFSKNKTYIRKFPNDPWGYNNLANMQMTSYYKLNSKTCEYYYTAYTLDSSNLTYLRNACNCSHKVKDYGMLYDFTGMLLKKDSTLTDIFLLRGVAIEKIFSDTITVEYYRRLAEKFNTEAGVLAKVYSYLESTGRCREAIALSESDLLNTTGRQGVGLWYKKAECYYDLGDLKNACECYVKANATGVIYIPSWRKECVEAFPGTYFPR